LRSLGRSLPDASISLRKLPWGICLCTFHSMSSGRVCALWAWIGYSCSDWLSFKMDLHLLFLVGINFLFRCGRGLIWYSVIVEFSVQT
jgi:hypothetical protein